MNISFMNISFIVDSIILLIFLDMMEYIPYVVIITTSIYCIVILIQVMMKHFNNNKKSVGTQTDRMSISFITN